MSRSTNNVASRARRKKILDHAKGYFGARSKLYRSAVTQVEKGWTYAYRDRKAKKREYRALWIIRINAGARLHGLSYSVFINGLKNAGIDLDRKALAHLAFHEPEAFEQLCAVVKSTVE